jgi:inositol transport system substrate-binding protein
MPRLAAMIALLAAGSGCVPRDDGRPVIGVSFDTLQTEYWVASRDAIAAEIAARGARMQLAVANNDANRQFEQVNAFIARGVDGIIIAPKDSQIVIPMIKLANRAKIPIVLYNRPPTADVGRCVTVVADNFAITRDTVTFLAEKAKSTGRTHRAAILIGDLGDANAIGRRDGFAAALEPYVDSVEIVARIPTEWNQEKALAGLTNALQAHPDIDFLFTSSDFLFPSVVSALRQAGKYHKIGEPGHVLLAGFDGDATAYRMLVDGYLDADGVQDVAFECRQSVDAIFRLNAGEDVPPTIRDPGFVAHPDNLDEARRRMWGAQYAK